MAWWGGISSEKELGKPSETLSGGYALANKQAEMYINSEIIRVSGKARRHEMVLN